MHLLYNDLFMKVAQNIMGMPITVEVLGGRDLDAAVSEVFDLFRAVDETFSTYKPGSEISRLNRGELSLAEASLQVKEVLAECEHLKRETSGYFDITRAGQIDPSGYVKGWAIYRAARLLDSRHITRYCLNAGGDMQLRGEGPANGPWVIGIANPFEPAKLAKKLYLTNVAVATSGSYERGQHIYNPQSGQLVTDPVSLTVVGATIDRVDAFATAAFCMGKAALPFLLQHGCEAMLVSAAGNVTLTPGFRRFETP
jgi:thiamine biosynthesis lipoprotein